MKHLTYFLFFSLVFTIGLKSCSVQTSNTNKTPKIGTTYQGGILFYVDSSGKHGLISAIDDFGDTKWGCVNVEIATDVGFGTGFQNTLKILEECSETPIAASEAVYYEINEYSNWYLPSLDELKEMYSSAALTGRNYRIKISGEKEHAGHVERSKHQGLKNVVESEKIGTYRIKVLTKPRK